MLLNGYYQCVTLQLVLLEGKIYVTSAHVPRTFNPVTFKRKSKQLIYFTTIYNCAFTATCAPYRQDPPAFLIVSVLSPPQDSCVVKRDLTFSGGYAHAYIANFGYSTESLMGLHFRSCANHSFKRR